MMKKKSVAVGYVLALFLGIIGGHLFYYKKYYRAILYLIFSWTYIPMFLGWIDMIFIKKWTEKHNSNLIPSNEAVQVKENNEEKQSVSTSNNIVLQVKDNNKNVVSKKKKSLFYNEEEIILDKYAHLTTTDSIIKTLEQFQSANNSTSTGGITFSVYSSSDELIKDSFRYATIEGTKTKEVPLVGYWPTFRDLSPDRLNWYLYWRGQTLKGNYMDVDLSYLCLFAYELLNYSFNSKAAFNVSMLVKLYENYKERIEKIENYFPRWIADMLYELEEYELAKQWDGKKVETPKVYNILEENLELKNLSITVWKPYLTGYRETGFFNTHKNKIYKQFKDNIGTIQDYYETQNVNLKDLWFEEVIRREVRSLFSSAVIARNDTQVHIHVTYIKAKVEMTKMISNLFKLSENMVRKSIGENRQLKVDDNVIPKDIQEKVLELNNRFKTVKKQEEEVKGSVIPARSEHGSKLSEEVNNIKLSKDETHIIEDINENQTSRKEVQFDWEKINQEYKELNELTKTFEEPLKDTVIVAAITKENKVTEKIHELMINTQLEMVNSNFIETSNEVGEEFISNLMSTEKQFLQLTSDSGIDLQEAASFAKSHGMMLNVFISDLNEKAEEFLGDILLEEGGDRYLVTEEFLYIIQQLK